MTPEEVIKARIEELKKERETHPAIIEGARIASAYMAAIAELEGVLKKLNGDATLGTVIE